MNENTSPQKKRWFQRRPTPIYSDHHLLPENSGRAVTTSSPNPLPETGSGRDHRRLGIFKTRSARNVGQSPPVSISQDHLPHTTLPSYANAELPDPEQRIGDASKAIASMKNLLGIVPRTVSTSDNVQPGLDAVDAVSSLIASLKVFNSIANEIANIHPYVKAVLSVFTCASSMILDQQDRDNAVQDLFKKLSEVYTFISEDGRLKEIQTMQELYGKVARQTLECADFIVHYSDTKSAWKRFAKDVFTETRAVIQSYSDALDSLMQQF